MRPTKPEWLLCVVPVNGTKDGSGSVAASNDR
jgi:hypothetical protein